MQDLIRLMCSHMSHRKFLEYYIHKHKKEISLKITVCIQTINSLNVCISQRTIKLGWALNIFIKQALITIDYKNNSVNMIRNSPVHYVCRQAPNILHSILKIMMCGAFVQHTSHMHIYVKRTSTITIFTMRYINYRPDVGNKRAPIHPMY